MLHVFISDRITRETFGTHEGKTVYRYTIFRNPFPLILKGQDTLGRFF